MFEGAKFRDLYETDRGQKAFYWCYSDRTKSHHLTIKGAHIAIQVDDNGKNCLKYNDDYYGFEDYFKVNIVGKWNDKKNEENE